MSGVGKTGLPDYRDGHSIWSVYLPYGIDRSQYIANCFNTGTVSLINENAEKKNRVKIGMLALQLVEFPLSEAELGSEVLCATMPYSGDIRVIDVYFKRDSYTQQKEDQFLFHKTNGSGTAGILIDGKGNIILSVDGASSNGVLTLSVTNKDRAGKLNINVNGDVNLINDGNTLVKSSKQVTIDSPKILLNVEDAEPILLGNKTGDLIKQILDLLGADSAGPYTLRNQAQYKELTKKIEELKSKLSFVK